MADDDFRRQLNRAFDDLSGPPSPDLGQRVRSAVAEAPETRGVFWLAAVAAVLLTAVIVGALYVANPLRRPPSTAGGGPASPSPAASAQPAASPTPSPGATASPFVCTGQAFMPKSTTPATTPTPVVFVDGLRTGAHGTYDRLTVQFANGLPAQVEISTQTGTAFTLSPSGLPARLKGANAVSVLIRGADLHSSYAGSTDIVTGYPGMAEVKRIEDYEGVVQLGIGVNGPACARAFFLTNPDRLVIDVQAA
jgi:hypothetical protein